MKRFVFILATTTLLWSCDNTANNPTNESKTVTTTATTATTTSLAATTSNTTTNNSQTPNNNELITELCKLPWKLSNFGDKSITGNNSLTFKPDGSFTAKICNNMNGTYITSDTSSMIQINVATSTKMMCQDVLGDAEMFFKSASFEIDITKGYLNIVKDGKYMSFERATTSKENPMAN